MNIDFQTIGAFCLFIGYPRSGTSLLGALLDAHPHMVISHELHALRYFREKSPAKEALFNTICRTSLLQAIQGRRQSGYSYKLAGSFQGQFQTLRVIGDKKAQGTSEDLLGDPDLLDRFRDHVGVPVKLVHIVRNPFDTISTVVRRSLLPGKGVRSRRVSMSEAIGLYFDLWNAGVLQTRARVNPGDWLSLHLESLVDNPRGELARVCGFLGVEVGAGYLEQCSEFVWESPRATRKKLWWTARNRARVLERARDADFLAHYEF